MSLRRHNTDETEINNSGDDFPVIATALRPHEPPPVEKPKAGDEHGSISVFWRVFGGTILSIIALVGITLYNSVITNIAELRSAVTKLHEEKAELLKKDEFGTRMNTNWERIQQLQAQNNEQNASLRSFRTEVDSLKEKLSRATTELDAAKKDLGALEVMKEKLNNLVAEAKNYREDYTKLRQDVDKNLASDQERKTLRDTQHKDVEKALKEFQASVQELQIKLARLEGRENPMPKMKKADTDKPGEKE